MNTTEADCNMKQATNIYTTLKVDFNPLSKVDNNALGWPERCPGSVTRTATEVRNIKHLRQDTEHFRSLQHAKNVYNRDKDIKNLVNVTKSESYGCGKQRIKSFYYKHWATTKKKYPGWETPGPFILQKFSMKANEKDGSKIIDFINERNKKAQEFEAELIEKRVEQRVAEFVAKRQDLLNKINTKFQHMPT